MNQPIRVRFAPSPTGPMHIGGVRTALYNYLFAKKNHGTFILRIEDTDRARYVPGAEQYIIESLKWFGIHFDEGPGTGGEFGPYRQSERKGLYLPYAEGLVKKGFAYYAFDSEEDLANMREQLKSAQVKNPQYNAITRSMMKNSLTLPEEEVRQRLVSGEPHVIRIKIPRNEEIRFTDLIRGTVVVHSSNIDDKILFKSDGMPTYHLANVVDDYLMKISHVIRGDEWMPSTPLHLLLYKYFGWEDGMPYFAHLPLILRPDGNGKLSKRDGDRLGFPLFPLTWNDPATGEVSVGYRERGYFPEAVVNLIAFLGWNPGDEREIFSMDELVKTFSLDRVGISGARFDHEKAKWFNRHYLHTKSDEKLGELLMPLVKKHGIHFGQKFLSDICRLMKGRVVFIPDIVSEGSYFFNPPGLTDFKSIEKKTNNSTSGIFSEILAGLKNLKEFNAHEIEKSVKEFISGKNLPVGEIMPLLRFFITGTNTGPSVPDIMEVLGKEESLNRIRNGIKGLIV